MGDEQVRPPVEVARPKPSKAVPFATAKPGTVQFTIKLDGWRLVVFHLADGPRLQTRAGRDVTPHFPELADAARCLPAGTVLDGEAVAWRDGAFDFRALAAGPAARRRASTAVAFVAFDLLADAGTDVRRLPLAERWARLEPLVAAVGPPFELILATTDRDEAMGWMHALGPQGVEGLVAKPLAGRYAGGTAGGWVKYRRRDTVDAAVVGLIGRAGRLRALRLELPGGRVVVTNDLTGAQARAVAEAVTELGADGLVVEIRLGHGRHGTANFVRIRAD